jgi:hypothetical protein
LLKPVSLTGLKERLQSNKNKAPKRSYKQMENLKTKLASVGFEILAVYDSENNEIVTHSLLDGDYMVKTHKGIVTVTIQNGKIEITKTFLIERI